MSGTRSGGRAAAATNKAKFGEDWYCKLGRKGGSVSRPTTRMFHVDRNLARRAGAAGGRISRRGKAKSSVARTGAGAVTVYDRKRGLVLSEAA